MKKLYRKGTVHPSPPIISDHLSFLPATILTLTAALSPEDREVLAYLISCSSNNNTFYSNWSSINRRKSSSHQKTAFYTRNSSSNNDHPPMFNCDCFRCYMSYWIRWDSSPNRQLIHEIIDAFEDWLLKQGKSSSTTTSGNKNRKERKRKGNNQGSGELIKRTELRMKDKLDESDSVDGDSSGSGGGEVGGGGGGGGGGGEEEGTDKGSVRKFVSFIGERIWGVLG